MKKTVRIGADPFPPYQYYDRGHVLRGIDYEKVLTTFQKAGYEAIVELHDWPIVEEKLNRGDYDAAFQVQPTPERLKKYFFSGLLREAATELVSSRKDIAVTGYSQIEEMGLTLGVLMGYTNGPEIDALPASTKKAYPDAAALLAAISCNEVDMGVFDRGVKEYLMENQGISNIYAIDAMTFFRPLHVIFTEEALRDAFNAQL